MKVSEIVNVIDISSASDAVTLAGHLLRSMDLSNHLSTEETLAAAKTLLRDALINLEEAR